jgi:peptidylprolyl isomerase
MTEAEEGDTVRVHYTGRTEEDGVFDTSEGREPFEFTLGDEEVIPGFNDAIEGMEEGDEKTVSIAPEDAYGERDPGAEMEIPLDQFPDHMDPQRGEVLEITDQQGARRTVEVKAVTHDEVVVDRNHPLAGKELTFDLELLEVVE